VSGRGRVVSWPSSRTAGSKSIIVASILNQISSLMDPHVKILSAGSKSPVHAPVSKGAHPSSFPLISHHHLISPNCRLLSRNPQLFIYFVPTFCDIVVCFPFHLFVPVHLKLLKAMSGIR
jgi:hypothetical protein